MKGDGLTVMDVFYRKKDDTIPATRENNLLRLWRRPVCCRDISVPGGKQRTDEKIFWSGLSWMSFCLLPLVSQRLQSAFMSIV